MQVLMKHKLEAHDHAIFMGLVSMFPKASHKLILKKELSAGLKSARHLVSQRSQNNGVNMPVFLDVQMEVRVCINMPPHRGLV